MGMRILVYCRKVLVRVKGVTLCKVWDNVCHVVNTMVLVLIIVLNKNDD